MARHVPTFVDISSDVACHAPTFAVLSPKRGTPYTRPVTNCADKMHGSEAPGLIVATGNAADECRDVACHV
ncbi:MAG: hypothetical protein HDS16_06300 [Bacteroides sp.]|nr:hypothetical protein [Bacteroides sp.]